MTQIDRQQLNVISLFSKGNTSCIENRPMARQDVSSFEKREFQQGNLSSKAMTA